MTNYREQITSITAHTVPSVWLGRQNTANNGWQDITTEVPYARVVGLTTAEGDEVWAPERVITDDRSGFLREQTYAYELPFKGVEAGRLLSFYELFLSTDAAGSIKTDYNCYRFVAWMKGMTQEGTAVGLTMGPGASAQERNLNVAELGAIVALQGSQRNPREKILHSLLGLGEDRKECLQVMWLFGHLGITRYEDVITFCSKRLNDPLRQFDRPVDVALYA